MITFLDENDAEYGALATIKATNAVNGERSLTGTIVSGDYVLSKIERGWRLRFDDEYYVVTYAKPVDEGRDVQVEFDAVHQFFWDFDKSSVYDQLADGSHTFVAYLDFIFKNSGYSYTVDSALNVYAFEKQSFGFKKRLTLFNDIITSTGVEFQVNGKVVRILEKVGTDLSTVVRKNFNMNELTIEKNIGDFVTYQKGYGAYFDEEDHSKGRLEVEYTSPLASAYGKLEAEPFVDERYSQSSSLLAVLKENVDNSYTISVSLDMEDLTRAGYKYKQPIAGDYIMAINETLDFQEKIRIVSFTSEYDVQGILVKHEVTCNDIGTVKKLSASYNLTKKQAASASDTASNAFSIANKALISADGKNTNYYGDSFPIDNPKGTLKTGDLLFLTVGDTVKQYYWNGADWVINPVIDDVEAFKEQIAEELKDVPNREEFENKISEEIANSKAEIGTQIETAKTQAETNAKEYADTINQETAKVAEQANAAADEIKADLVNVKNNLTSTSIVANNAQAAVDEAKQDLIEVTSGLNTAKQDLMSHAQQLQTQANAQTELTNRVTTVETTANGTKTTVNELTKTVAQNGKDIVSVTNRTKTVEDDLANTKTTLTQVQTTADSASQKTATLETGLNGLSAKFDSLSVGNKNYLPASRVVNRGCSNFSYSNTSKVWTMTVPASSTAFGNGITFNTSGLNILLNGGETLFFGLMIKTNKACSFNYDVNNVLSGTTSNDNDDTSKRACSPSNKSIPANVWMRVWFSYTAKTNVPITEYESNFGIVNNTEPVAVEIKEIMVAKSNVPVDYQTPDADVEQKIAEYKQTADQNYASLQSNLQTLDGTVKQNKSEFDQTASQLKTTISAVEGKIPKELGGSNLYALSKNAGIYTRYITDFVQNVETGEISFKVTGRDPFFGSVANKGENVDSIRGVKIPIKTGQGIAVYLTNELLVKNFVSYFGEDNNAVKNYKNYQTNKFIIPASELEGVSYVTFRFGLVEETQEVGSIHSTKIKVEYGNVYTDWSPASEDTTSRFSSLSSQIQQTADGMTLLATKTELNVLSGRVTTAENSITAKANELSSKITSVEGKIPNGEMNLVQYGRPADGYSPYAGAVYAAHQFYYNGAYKMYIIKNAATSEKTFGMNRFKVERNTDYTLYFKGFNNSAITHMDVWFLKRVSGSTQEWDSAQILVNSRKLSAGAAEEVIVTFNTGNYDEGYLRFDNNGSTTAGTRADLYFGDVSVKKGKSNKGWSPSLAELASSQDLKTAQSEFKQTTDSIKASVQSLDNSTVKTSSLTINTDGVVIKAGKSTSDFANAIGSYFSVNQNAINLFSDKINVKGSMIVSGAITSDKIASKQINTAHLNGKIITADVISSNAVTADAIKAGAVTTDKMSANSINGDRITAGTLDAAKIKAGSITASQIASGTITSAQIKTGTISAANIAAGAITSDKIASNSIDASKIAANAITANMITGGQLRSTNGATVFDLNAGTLTFNNNYGYIQRVAGDKIFEITTYLGTSLIDSRDHLTSAFKVRKSDNSRQSGIQFSLYNMLDNKPTATTKINSDSLDLYDSQNTILFSVNGRGTWLGNFNLQGWGDIPVAQIHGGLIVKDIGIGGRSKSLLNIVEELCKKAGILWA